MKKVYLIILLLTLSITKTNKLRAQVNQQDSLALVDLYNSTQGAYWKQNRNWLTITPVSKWYGITVANKRVKTIELNFNKLRGTIPVSIGNIDSLTILQLYGNNLSDTIPSSLTHLAGLNILSLGSNKLSGNLPTTIGNLLQLTSLDFQYNKLTGSIPASIGKLVNLQELYANYNSFTGTIPGSIKNFIYIQRMFLDDNNLSGQIPADIGNLTQLEQISLSNNNISGKIPASVTNLVNLHLLDFSYNQLTDTIPALPASLGKTYDGSFNDVQLNNNQLRGNIPTLGNDSSKRYFDKFNLSNNKLTGNIPSYIGYFTVSYDGGEFNLSNNQLSGSIPVSFKNITTPEIYLDHNNLSGAIPTEFGEMQLKGFTGEVVYADLSYNKLSGIIPSSLKNMADYGIHLNLSHNNLSGSIPNGFAAKDVYDYLDLSDNQLSGIIPANMYKLYSLGYLYLDSNQLTGKLSDDIVNMVHLRVFDISQNKLSGALPASLDSLSHYDDFRFASINLSHNNFSGNITNINALSNVSSLNLSYNQFSGSLSQSLFKDFLNLDSLNLSNNQFTGNIPSSLTNSRYIQTIDAGNNLFGNRVPSFLTTLDNLYKLIISNNKYTFDGLEAVVLHGFDTLQYSQQANIALKKNNTVLHVDAGGTLSNNTYKWFQGNELVATIQGDSSYTPTHTGKYSVTVSNAIATELTLYSDTIHINVPGFSNATASSITNNNFSVYPNPAKTFATVSFNAGDKLLQSSELSKSASSFNADDNIVLKLNDANGHLLQTKNISAFRGANTIKIDVSTYAAGVYFITLTDGKKQSQTLQLSR